MTSTDSTLARAASGYRSTLLSHAIRLACKIAGVVVLARVVSPAEHGRFAMAASVTFLLAMFRDFGTSAAAIQAPVITEGQKSALLRLHACLGVALAGLLLLLAPLAATFFQERQLISLLATMSVSFVLIGLGSWPRTLLNRELRFEELNRLETAGALTGTLAMIGAGIAGAGAYSFVAFLLVSEAVMTTAAWRHCRWRPLAPADWNAAGALAETGLHLTGYNLLLFGLQQADTLLMGRWFGAAPLGAYNRAGLLLMQPTTHLAAPFSQVLLSALSRLDATSTVFAEHFRATTNAIAHFTLPVVVVCGVLPHETVRLVLGADWPEAAPLLAWLSVSAAVSFLTSTVYALCVATGHSARLTQLTALALPITIAGLWFGRAHGPIGLAAGLATANVILLLPRLWWSARGTAVSFRDFGVAFAGPLLVAMALAVGLLGGRALVIDTSLPIRLGVALLGGALAVALLTATSARVRREFSQLLSHLPLRGGSAANATP